MWFYSGFPSSADLWCAQLTLQAPTCSIFGIYSFTHLVVLSISPAQQAREQSPGLREKLLGSTVVGRLDDWMVGWAQISIDWASWCLMTLEDDSLSHLALKLPQGKPAWHDALNKRILIAQLSLIWWTDWAQKGQVDNCQSDKKFDCKNSDRQPGELVGVLAKCAEGAGTVWLDLTFLLILTQPCMWEQVTLLACCTEILHPHSHNWIIKQTRRNRKNTPSNPPKRKP